GQAAGPVWSAARHRAIGVVAAVQAEVIRAACRRRDDASAVQTTRSLGQAPTSIALIIAAVDRAVADRHDGACGVRHAASAECTWVGNTGRPVTLIIAARRLTAFHR